jgi:hypothetical protein
MPLDEPVDDALVPVVAPEVGITVGRLDLEDTIAEVEQRHVEGPAAEIENENGLLGALFVEAVGQRCGGRLVDDAEDLESRDLSGLLGGLALSVVEVGGNRDDRLGDLVAEIRLGVGPELGQDPGRDLLWRPLLTVDVGALVRAHGALDRADGAIWVRDGLPLGDLADEDLAALREGDDGRRGASALGVGDDGGLATLKHRHYRVSRAEVDSYCFRHD